jgi:uncharacterized repeat protein (TIGR01451 family)
MVIGQPVTDQGGTQYVLPAGVFRFPLVAPGNYRIEVVPPANYIFPTRRTIAELQTLPNAPFRLQPGSFGQNFVVTSAPAVAVDVPLDPSNSLLVLRKTAGQQIATTGDFVQYTLTLENTSEDGPVALVDLTDRLPAGARYRAGSLHLNGTRIADPTLSADGTSFTYRHPLLAAGESITLRYVVEFTVAMRGTKDAINTAQAVAPGNVRSNEARALVRMNEELFSQKGFVLGRVFEGSCDDDGRENYGVANVRVYLEDGRYSITDANGHYHFDDLDPGTHSVQLDKLTPPDFLELARCPARIAWGTPGRDYSQFAELRPGTMWRSDFALRQKAAPSGDVQFEFHSALAPEGDDIVMHEAVLRVNGVSTGKTRMVVMLPDHFEYVAGSVTVDGERATDKAQQLVGAGEQVLSANDGVITVHLGELAPGSVRTVRFATHAASSAGGTLPVRAFAIFDTPAKSGVRTQQIESQLSRGAARFGRSQFTIKPRFDVLKTELSPTDEEALHDLIRSWHGARDITIRAVGHSDSQPISGRHREVFPDNYALSHARAQAVADYLAISLAVPESRVQVIGRGSDEPVAAGNDPASRAANRRVEIVIEGSRFEANAPLELAAAGGKSETVATQGVILRGPSTGAKRAPRSVAADDKLGMGVVLDVDALKPGVGWLPLADATRRFP